jgi:hypothetical protein
MPTGFRCRRSFAAALLLLASACVDRNPLSPDGTLPAPEPLATIQCQVTVATGRMSCSAPVTASSAEGARMDRILGGQELYLKLASSGTSYDSGTEILSTTVTLQNLLARSMGTHDGSTVEGVEVFFHVDPIVTGGTGSVSVANADGIGTFTSGTQPYFLYNQILAPYEISAGKLWQFSVTPTVETFSFTLLISAPLPSNDTGGTPLLDAVWQGGVDSLWTRPQNWLYGVVPDSNSIVSIPALATDSVANMPKLTGNVAIAALRVGTGSTLTLGGFTLASSGNVDASGTISGGTVRMTGAGGLLGGNVNALVVTGGTALQGATKATGAVSIQDGPLNLNGKALSISVP